MEAVDDVNSPYYNQIVDTNKVPKTWNSAERLGSIDVYEYGAVVGFNQDPMDRKAGSAIFIHLWRKPGHPTAGCTAMSKKSLLSLLHWLEKEKAPVIVQLTHEDYKVVQEFWGLPEVIGFP